MNILIAFDKFKDALPADQICEHFKNGILKSFPTANCQLLPLADGGEGTLNVLAKNLEGEFIACQVHDPIFRPIQAEYLWVASQQMAIIEMARASGFELLLPHERNCLETTTYGTGELIKNAIEKGAKKIVLTVGGSATNDAGVGMAAALGYKFYDKNKQPLQPIGKNLIKINSLEIPQNTWQSIDFQVITDVTNPFSGKNGAAFVYAPQKGADQTAVAILDDGLKNIANIFEQYLHKSIAYIQGSGAGGGIGGGIVAFLNARISSAANWILEVCDINYKLKDADLLITGEGRIDKQSWQGKLIACLNELAETNKVPVLLVCGTLQDIEQMTEQQNIIFATSILDAPMSLDFALKNTANLIENQGLLLGKLLKNSKINLHLV